MTKRKSYIQTETDKMKVKISNGIEFKKLLTVLNEFNDNLVLTCLQEKFEIFCLTSCHTSIMTVDIPNTYFKEFQYETDMKLGIRLKVWLGCLKKLTSKDEVTLEHKEGTNECKLIITKEDREIEYIIKLMDIEQDAMEIPECDWNIQIEMASTHLKNLVAEVVDNTCAPMAIEPTKESINLQSEGQEFSVKTTQEYTEDCYAVVNNAPKPISLSAKSWKIASKSGDISDTIRLGWQNDVPVNVRGTFGKGARFNMWFAPMMGNDDDEEMS